MGKREYVVCVCVHVCVCVCVFVWGYLVRRVIENDLMLC